MCNIALDTTTDVAGEDFISQHYPALAKSLIIGEALLCYHPFADLFFPLCYSVYGFIARLPLFALLASSL